VLDAMTRLVLTNAIYLKAPWLYPFDEGGTADAPFVRLDGSRVQAPFMHLGGFLHFASGDGWQAVSLPYLDAKLEMVILVPDTGRFAATESSLDRGLLEEVGRSFEGERVDLRMPRWEFRTQAGLNQALGELGMPTAFSDAADFSAISSAEPLQISAVLHEAFISVDEKGTEAAAATAMVVMATGAPVDPPVRLTVDRPFLFWIADKPTGAILFLGRVVDPT
jgi:serpin B